MLQNDERSSLGKLLGIKWEHIECLNYTPHPKIAADVAV